MRKKNKKIDFEDKATIIFIAIAIAASIIKLYVEYTLYNHIIK